METLANSLRPETARAARAPGSSGTPIDVLVALMRNPVEVSVDPRLAHRIERALLGLGGDVALLQR